MRKIAIIAAIAALMVVLAGTAVVLEEDGTSSVIDGSDSVDGSDSATDDESDSTTEETVDESLVGKYMTFSVTGSSGSGARDTVTVDGAMTLPTWPPTPRGTPT